VTVITELMDTQTYGTSGTCTVSFRRVWKQQRQPQMTLVWTDSLQDSIQSP